MQLFEHLESQALATVGLVSPALSNHLAKATQEREETGAAETMQIVMYAFGFTVVAAAIAMIIWLKVKDTSTNIPNAQDPNLGK